jgi:hypothetical protein
MAVPNTGANPAVKSTASFASDAFNFDPLLAGECISESHLIASGLGVLKRGTVLLDGAAGTPIGTLTTAAGTARCILADDIDTGSGGPVTALVYTQGKFLDTAMTFSTNGAATDVAQLWNVGVYVLSVLQRSGDLVPIRSLPGTPGPLPQEIHPEAAAPPAGHHHTGPLEKLLHHGEPPTPAPEPPRRRI